MGEQRTYRVSSEHEASAVVTALVDADFEAQLSDEDDQWLVRIEVEPQTLGDAQRIVLDLDPDAVDVSQAEHVNHATDL